MADLYRTTFRLSQSRSKRVPVNAPGLRQLSLLEIPRVMLVSVSRLPKKSLLQSAPLSSSLSSLFYPFDGVTGAHLWVNLILYPRKKVGNVVLSLFAYVLSLQLPFRPLIHS